jgi:hypothetical protein
MSWEPKCCGTCAKLDKETCTAIKGEIDLRLSCWESRNDAGKEATPCPVPEEK